MTTFKRTEAGNVYAWTGTEWLLVPVHRTRRQKVAEIVRRYIRY